MISDYYYPLDFTENCNCFTKLNVVLFSMIITIDPK